MGHSRWGAWKAAVALSMGILATGVCGNEVLETSGFMTCAEEPTIKVQRVNIRYNNNDKVVTFDVAGSSEKQQNVTAALDVKAYGIDIYQNSFNPCDDATYVEKLCPVPEGDFQASGSQEIPAEFADLVPGIAFQFPDIAAQATLRLKSLDTDEDVACIKSQVTNGKTANLPAVSYVAAGIAGAALVMSGVSAVGSAMAGGGAASSGAGGSGTVSPGFTEVVGWFQGIAMNGMMSVNYPPVYRSFTKNFAFSTGMIPFEPLQRRIDDFRAATGGNLTQDSVEFLKNATLVFPDGSSNTGDQNLTKVKRAMDTFAHLTRRQFNFDTSVPEDEAGGTEFEKTVSGIQAFAEQLRVPGSDIFMSVLLILAIVIAAIIVFILLFKVILEVWAIWGNFPPKLAGFRKHYWGSIARTITTLIFVLYGIWVLYCVFQFTRGDSWAATTLAGVTLAVFTAILLFFSYKIWSTARKLKSENGDTHALYDSKSIWTKYSLFYDSYKKDYWWVFLPLIIYMAAKGCVLAAADGSGRAQTIAILAVESVMLVLLLWSRPFERKSGNVVNIVIQVVRVLSVVCILVFVEEFGIRQTTQTVTGIVLIAIQSTLTIILVILIAWHAFEACFRENPHRRRRKELEKMNRDLDDLTPLGARTSIDKQREDYHLGHSKSGSYSSTKSLDNNEAARAASLDRFYGVSVAEEGQYRPPIAPSGGPHFKPATPTTRVSVIGAQEHIATPQEYSGRQPAFPTVNSTTSQPYRAPPYQPLQSGAAHYRTGSGYRGL